MTNHQKLDTDEVPQENKLIHLGVEARANGQAKDINIKIKLLEDSLYALQSELAVINKSVDAGMARLGDSDLDLTSKVAETYKRLGEIDSTYKALSVISDNIDSEVKKLTEEISDIAAQSAADIAGQSSQFTQLHEQVVDRVNELVSQSQDTSTQLAQSIKDNTDALLKLEKGLVAEIDSLANTTRERSDNIEQEVESSKARILKLQSVDVALEKRAALVEADAANLTQKSEKLRTSVELLDMRTGELSTLIDKLLEEGEKHASLIATLQDKTVEMAMAIKALAGTENRHFKIVSGFLLVALLAIAGLYFYHQSEMTQDAVVTAERTQVVDQHISSLQQDSMNSALTISEVQDNLITLNKKLDDKIKTVNNKLQTVDDQAQTLAGQINNMSPFSQIGSNNVIHGPNWLAQQPVEQFAIQVTTVNDRQGLYETALRYSRILNDELSYYTLKTAGGEKFVLISGGYSSDQEAAAVIRRLPRYVNLQRPAITRMAEVQQQL